MVQIGNKMHQMFFEILLYKGLMHVKTKLNEVDYGSINEASRY